MSDNTKELVVVPARHMGQTIEMIKRLRPDIVIQESDCQQQRDALLEACEKTRERLIHICAVGGTLQDFIADGGLIEIVDTLMSVDTAKAAIAAAK